MRGFYVPSLKTPETLRCPRIVRNLDAAVFTGEPIVPYLNIVHDRVALESHARLYGGCRFVRRGISTVRCANARAKRLCGRRAQQIGCTGYDEVSLLSLSTGDYSEVHTLVPQIIREMEQGKVSVSLPSLRVDSELANDLTVMQSVRKAVDLRAGSGHAAPAGRD
jgi:hypothetical protein